MTNKDPLLKDDELELIKKVYFALRAARKKDESFLQKIGKPDWFNRWAMQNSTKKEYILMKIGKWQAKLGGEEAAKAILAKKFPDSDFTSILSMARDVYSTSQQPESNVNTNTKPKP